MFALKAKSWQAFLATVVAMLLLNVHLDDPLIEGLLYAAGLVIYFSWFAALGNVLADWIPRGTHYSRTWFLVDVFFVLAGFSLVAVLFDDHSYTGTGLAALPVLYLFFALFHVFWFTAVVLVAIEKNSKPEFGFYFRTLLLMLFWPVGVWFVQPRLNRLAAEKLNAADKRF
jgi:uncharacterized membrane protein YwaF